MGEVPLVHPPCEWARNPCSEPVMQVGRVNTKCRQTGIELLARGADPPPPTSSELERGRY